MTFRFLDGGGLSVADCFARSFQLKPRTHVCVRGLVYEKSVLHLLVGVYMRFRRRVVSRIPGGRRRRVSRLRRNWIDSLIETNKIVTSAVEEKKSSDKK